MSVVRPPFGPSVGPSAPPSQTGAFGTSARALVAAGIVVIPTGGPSGKVPLIRWRGLTLRRLQPILEKLLQQFPEANVGILCGASGLVVVDVDDPDLLAAMLERFGQTPLITSTPSEGFHAFYAQPPQRLGCHNLRRTDGLDVDIKGDGGLVIAPPSLNVETGLPYRFVTGTWSDVGNLPPIRCETLSAPRQPKRRRCRLRSNSSQRVAIGQRNETLFSELLKAAPHCDDVEALLDVARTKNTFAFEAPLPDREVRDTARSAWRYEQAGRNWSGRAARTVLARPELLFFARHKRGGDALILWAFLAAQHASGTSFALDREAMARDQVLPNWTGWRYRSATETLLDLRLLEIVGGGYRRGDGTFAPYQYNLLRPVADGRQDIIETGFFWGGDGAPNEDAR